MGTWVRVGEGLTVDWWFLTGLYTFTPTQKEGVASSPQLGLAGKAACKAHKPNICSDKNLEVPCPQICPFWDGPQLELPGAVSFHLRGRPMEEGGVQGRLCPPLHFCGEVGEKRVGLLLASHWVCWDLMNAFSRLWGSLHSSSLTVVHSSGVST